MQRAHNSVLHVLGEHDDEARVLLPHHAPEVHHGVVQRSLARDVVVADVAGALETEVTHNYVTQVQEYHFTKYSYVAVPKFLSFQEKIQTTVIV